jgi:hypothetical protein
VGGVLGPVALALAAAGCGGSDSGGGGVLPPSSEIERAIMAWDFDGSGLRAASAQCTTVALDRATCDVALTDGNRLRVTAQPGSGPTAIALDLAGDR